ncbi:MAG: UbiX family flavin prenyltransferase [Betaproteobacteria bacterium]|nr:UbiX family flavin prenyltransferase [Betaproteobacteria bacterium]
MIVGISGASGTIYAVRALEMLRKLNVETHLVMSRSAQVTLAYEMDLKVKDIEAMADVVYRNEDIGAAISSGSFKNLGLRVAPLLDPQPLGDRLRRDRHAARARPTWRSGERRRVVLMVRETPNHLGHLRSMTAVTEMGAIVMPPVPAFYTKPKTIDDIVNHSVGRALDLFGLDTGMVKRWGEDVGPKG